MNNLNTFLQAGTGVRTRLLRQALCPAPAAKSRKNPACLYPFVPSAGKTAAERHDHLADQQDQENQREKSETKTDNQSEDPEECKDSEQSGYNVVCFAASKKDG